jgi:hypothetical protein
VRRALTRAAPHVEVENNVTFTSAGVADVFATRM